jgi:hypothetical protein
MPLILFMALGYNVHMIFEMLRWWYVTGWLQATHRIGEWTKSVERTFSIKLLARTLFAPWRRIISVSGRSFDDKMRAALDNFVSRCVGFFVRSGVLIVAAIATFVTFTASVLMVGIWPLLPFIFVYCLVRSITG